MIVGWTLLVSCCLERKFHEVWISSGLYLYFKRFIYVWPFTKPACHGFLYGWCLHGFWFYLNTLKNVNSSPRLLSFLKMTSVMEAEAKWKFCSESTRLPGKGCPFLLIHPKLICAIAASLALLRNSFDLKVGGSKFQEPGTLLMWLEKE